MAAPRARRLLGRVLVLLGIRNELRRQRAPGWRLERNRIEIDRAIAAFARAHAAREQAVTKP